MLVGRHRKVLLCAVFAALVIVYYHTMHELDLHATVDSRMGGTDQHRRHHTDTIDDRNATDIQKPEGPHSGGAPIVEDKENTQHIQRLDKLPGRNPITKMQLDTGSEHCSATIYQNQTVPETPYKIFIYDLPTKFNKDLMSCIHRVMRLQQCAYGPTLFQNHGVIFTNIWQFTLDIILHHKLMFSPYRTLDPEKADVFFIPFYGASSCFCRTTYKTAQSLVDALLSELQQFPYYQQGKPHVLAIGKIEREERYWECPLLLHPATSNMTLIGIEADDYLRYSDQKQKPPMPEFIVAPYPSYIHFLQPDGGDYYKNLFSHHRRVFIFLAAGNRRSAPFRNQIVDQMDKRTKLSIEQYYHEMQYSESTELDSMWLVTPHQNSADGANGNINWMHESVFCLQPPGDSPTRKSIYDGILSGCIPVFFEYPFTPKFTLPFQDVFDYSKFSLTIPMNATKNFKEIIGQYRFDTDKIRLLQKNLQSIIPYMQYSYPLDNREHTDAMKPILDQLGRTLGLQTQV